MAVVITSTTSSQEDLNHAVSDEWREPLNKPVEAEPAEEPEEPPAVEGAAEPEPKEEKPKPKEHKSGWQKRIDKLTARNHSLESRNAELEAKLKPPEAPAQKSTEPKLSDYGNDVEKYVAARDNWKQSEETRQADQEDRKVILDEYNKKVSEARGKYDDWDEAVAGSNITIPQAAYDEVIESGNGTDIAYYLATHPDEAAKLIEMRASEARRVITRIGDKLAKEAEKPAAKAEKPKPPAPLAPVGASATRTGNTLDTVSIKDYIKIRNKQERENRRL
jgi:hypothetical protein